MRIKDDSKIKNILKIVSPGTNLREGLENILRAKTGGLIVLSDNEEVMKLVDGGFYINSEYSPAYIYELAKMDGAIVISEDLKRIVCANAQLLPDPSVSTFETGTRHRTAQRIAKQTDAIWVFYGWGGINATVEGVDCDYWNFKDIDPVFDYYTPVMIANNDFLKDSPDEAKAFLAATEKGYQYAIDNPKKAADILIEGLHRIS